MIGTSQTNQQQGFTILELMIAMVISSLILAACAAAFVQVSRMYYRGYIQAKTQELTRQTIEDITRPIQFSGELPVVVDPPVPRGGVNTYALCISGRRYSYAKGYQLSESNDIPNRKLIHALWMDPITTSVGCTPLDITQPDPGTDALSDTSANAFKPQELLMPLTRVSELKVQSTTSNLNIPGLYQVNLAITYGDEDLLVCQPSGNACSTPGSDLTTATCAGGIFGSQFCARSELNTVVSRRLK